MASKKNQIVIDLGKTQLSPASRKTLQDSIHKVVADQIQHLTAPANTKSAAPPPPVAVAAQPPVTTANIQATFTNTNPGATQFVATLNTAQQTLSQSGTVSFNDVGSGDLILIQVNSLGTATITIDVNATPTQMIFPPGSHSKNFVIN